MGECEKGREEGRDGECEGGREEGRDGEYEEGCVGECERGRKERREGRKEGEKEGGREEGERMKKGMLYMLSRIRIKLYSAQYKELICVLQWLLYCNKFRLCQARQNK